MEKLLTISVAAYNVDQYLENTLRSCICSNMDKLQVLVMNDGSKDDTEQIAKKFEDEYPQTFKCITKENGGYGSTINKAVEYAAGKYFKLLDGDDWYDTNNLDILLTKLDSVDSDMVVTDYTEVFEVSKKKIAHTFNKYTPYKNYSFSEACKDFSIAMHAVMFKTELFRDHHIKITEKCFYTDTEFMLLPLPFVKTISFVPLDIYQYRLGLNGQSVSLEGMRKHYEDGEKVVFALLQYLNKIDSTETQKRKFMIDHIAISADFQLRAFMCCDKSDVIKNRIIQYDQKLKEASFEVYKAMENPLTLLLRKTNYKTYSLYCDYTVFVMKAVQVLHNR